MWCVFIWLLPRSMSKSMSVKPSTHSPAMCQSSWFPVLSPTWVLTNFSSLLICQDKNGFYYNYHFDWQSLVTFFISLLISNLTSQLNSLAFMLHKFVLQSSDIQTWLIISLRSTESETLRREPKDMYFSQTPVVIPRSSQPRNLSIRDLSSSTRKEKQNVSPQIKVKLECHKRLSTAIPDGFMLG